MNSSDAPLLVSRPDGGAICWMPEVRADWRRGLAGKDCRKQATVEIQGTTLCSEHGAVVLAGGIEEALERSES